MSKHYLSDSDDDTNSKRFCPYDNIDPPLTLQMISDLQKCKFVPNIGWDPSTGPLELSPLEYLEPCKKLTVQVMSTYVSIYNYFQNNHNLDGVQNLGWHVEERFFTFDNRDHIKTQHYRYKEWHLVVGMNLNNTLNYWFILDSIND